MSRQFSSLVRLAGYEVWRTRFGALVSVALLVAWGVGQFAATLAVTESAAHATVLYAASARLGLVFVVSLLIITNVIRDGDDRVLDLMLSRPLKRSSWFCAKFAAYALAAWAASIAASLPLFALGLPWRPVLAWTYSLGCELMLMVAAALTAAISLAQVTAAFVATCAFYGLSRALHALVLLSRDPLVDPNAPLTRAIGAIVRGISFALPDLAAYTLSSWLVYAPPTPTELWFISAQTLLYAALLLSVGLLDFQRRNF